jgi:hypothetical protein
VNNEDEAQDFLLSEGFTNGAGQEAQEGLTGEPNPNLSIRGLLDALADGSFEDWVRDNAPKPCPATVAIMKFTHREMIEHAEQVAVAASEVGNPRIVAEAFQVNQWLKKSLAKLEEASAGVNEPEFTFDDAHELLSLSNPGFLCEAQVKANKAIGFDGERAINTVAMLRAEMAKKPERSEAMKNWKDSPVSK